MNFTASLNMHGFRCSFPGHHTTAVDFGANSILHRLQALRRDNGGLVVCGNGGSACNASHLVEDLRTQLDEDRRLAAHCLTDSAGVLTALANDWRYRDVFAMQLDSVFPPGVRYAVLLFSGSGNSENILAAAEYASKRDITVMAVTAEESPLASYADALIPFPKALTTPVQEELQLVFTHWLVERLNA